MRAGARLRERRKPDAARNTRAAHRNARQPNEYHRAHAPAAADSTPAPEQYAASYSNIHADSADEHRDGDSNINAVAHKHTDRIINQHTNADARGDGDGDCNGERGDKHGDGDGERDAGTVGKCCT